ncbi:hypothetical protein [Adlercreutzia sp. ZJ154]|uniref:hypothetical protein n=1 Tax=Adlercreutzia sp. ZJ154 TaxID=2709790 RepID=UPI0013ECE5DC|nr:hypothetical protein [Adlercreutzia sp. ZJ154]
MKVNTEDISDCIFAFVRTMDAYDYIVKELPLCEELWDYSKGNINSLNLSEVTKADSAYIDIRLMLQRKYFSHGGNVYLPDLLRVSRENQGFDTKEIDDLLDELDTLNNRPMELVSPNGCVIESNYKIAETMIYGHCLHADADKLNALLHLPAQTLTMLIAPFVLGRENILRRARNLFSTHSFETAITNGEASGFICLDNDKNEERDILTSPFWKNAYGHDASYDEICSSAESNSLDDNIAVLLAAVFFEELSKPDYDIGVLRELVWDDYWEDWGDFSEDHQFASSFEHPSFSSSVLHEGGENYAQVKFLPHVDNPWITKTQQYPLCETCLVLLSKRKNEWKINGLMRSTLDES